MARRRILVVIVVIVASLGTALAPAGGAPSATHAWHLSLGAPAQFGLVLAEVRFPARTGRPRRLSLRGPAGLNFVAGASVRRPPSGGPRTLVLVINRRPPGSLAPDLRRIGLTVTAARSLGAPSLRATSTPVVRPVGGVRPSICRLGLHGRPLGAGALQVMLGAGRTIPGFGAAAAVAQAYDLVCGLPYDPAFVSAATGCPAATIGGCCPPNAVCAAPAPGPGSSPGTTPPTTTPPTPPPGITPPPACPPCPPCGGRPCPLVPVRIACLAPAPAAC
jgi:hypothetical protein